MKIIGYVPLGETDGALLGVILPDSLEKSRRERTKLHRLGGGRIILGCIDQRGDCIR